MRNSLKILALVGICSFSYAETLFAQEADSHARAASGEARLGRYPSEILMTKITVSDVSRSNKFYREIIGLKPTISGAPRAPAPDGPPHEAMEVPLNFSGSLVDTALLLIHSENLHPSPESTRLVWIVLKVPDASSVIRRAKAAGFDVLKDVPQVEAGKLAVGLVRDPDGYTVEIVQAASNPM